jgi:hypothetical protein
MEWYVLHLFVGLSFGALGRSRIQRCSSALALLELPGCTPAAIARSDSVVSRRNLAPIASSSPCVLPYPNRPRVNTRG